MNLEIDPVIIYLESEHYKIAFPVECQSKIKGCMHDKLRDIEVIVYKLLNGESSLDEYDDETRVVLFTILYGGAILFFKSSRGVLPIARQHINTPLGINAVGNIGEPRMISDKDLLEAWSIIITEGKIPENQASCPRVKIIEERDCRVPPTGYRFY
ncbi:MAG: hypothetical protein F7C36_02505 [Desulfurococcales archaeon]|nr:hypothetical protein [Desulfurococcales archaeon]